MVLLEPVEDVVAAPSPVAALASVPRTALVGRLRDGSHTVVWVSAPAGAGKTTLVEQWARSEDRPHHRVPLAKHLDDPAVLAEAVVGAFDTIGPPEPMAQATITGQEPTFSAVVLPGLAALAESRSTPYVLVLDDLHLVSDPDSIRVVRALADAVPPGSTLALVSRGSPPTWLARFRAADRLQELTTEDLAFDDDELDALLAVLDVTMTSTERDALLRRTEGWAVALYLEALALRQSRPVAGRPSPESTGDRAFARDYIEAEVLDPLQPATRDFLLRTSILDQISIGACDAVLERTDSAAVLEGLRRSTPLVTLLDPERGVYRYHHLLHDTSRALLAADSDAPATAALHGRAAQWYGRQGDVDAAVRHASRAGDVDATATLIWSYVAALMSTGRPDRLARWLDEQPAADLEDNRWLTQAAAWSAMQSADLDAMRRWILRSEAHAGRDWRDRVGVEPYVAALATLEAIVGAFDLRETAALCTDALEGMHRDDQLRAAAAFIGGVSLTLLRDPAAVPMLLQAHELARALDVPLVEADALSWRGLVAILSGEVAEGTRLILEATALIADHDLERLATSAHCITAQALAYALRGDRERATSALATSRRLTTAADGIAPWFHVCGRLIQAQAALHLGEGAMGRMLLGEARSMMTPELAQSVAQDLLGATETMLEATSAAATSLVPLTPAEMRVLQFLPSHLTYAQIGDHLFLSGNTVKTHAMSVYRKLGGASSRNEAVTRARELGLVESPMRS